MSTRQGLLGWLTSRGGIMSKKINLVAVGIAALVFMALRPAQAEDDPTQVCKNRYAASDMGDAMSSSYKSLRNEDFKKCMENAKQLKQSRCDTLHTSDTRGIWQCGNVCVRVFGNAPKRYLTVDGVDPYKEVIRFKAGPTYENATLNGKKCKALNQTYDYDETGNPK